MGECTCISCVAFRNRPVDPKEQAVRELRAWCHENLNYINEGGTRLVYQHPFDPNWVIKIPAGANCISCQESEIKAIEKAKLTKAYPVPEVRVEMWEFDIPIIHMEKVTPIHGEKYSSTGGYKEAWMEKISDGCQVGRTKDGRIVPYDLGYQYE